MKQGIVCMLLLVVVATAASALEGDFDRFPEEIQVGAQTLVRRGVGRMRRWMITGADVALYTLPGLGRDAVLEDEPKALSFYYYVGIRGEQFARAAEETLQENSPGAMLDAHRGATRQMGAWFATVKRGDRYLLSYEPGRGTVLALNGKDQGQIAGASFAALYFRIWLGTPPIDARMYEGLTSDMR